MIDSYEEKLDQALDDYESLSLSNRFLSASERPSGGNIARAFNIHGEEIVLAQIWADATSPVLPDQGREEEELYGNAYQGKLAEIIFKKFCVANGVQVYADPTVRNEGESDEGDIIDADDCPLDLDVKSVMHFHNNLLVKCASPSYRYYVVVALALKHNRAKVLGWIDRGWLERNVLVKGDIIPDTKGKKARYDLYQRSLKELNTSDEELRVFLEKIKSGRLKKEPDNVGPDTVSG